MFFVSLRYRKVKMTLSLSLAKFFSTKLPFYILFSSASRAHPSQDELWWTEGSCSGKASSPGLPQMWKRALTRKYLRGLGNLRSSASYNRVNTVYAQCTRHASSALLGGTRLDSLRHVTRPSDVLR